jgi:tetratricopeptide (TPR) repeat protein
MIVRDEAPVIERCLASVKPWVDSWVIVDTGSNDGTQQRVRDAMAGVEGELHERPWQDFAHNRNEALELARGRADYVLFIDADEILAMPPDFRWPALTADGYLFRCAKNGWNYWRNSLAASRCDWRWEGVLHEALLSRTAASWDTLAGPRIEVREDGARGRDPSTYLKDIEVLKRAVQQDQANTRYAFYLAQSYRDAGLLPDSLHWYRQRAAMGGWDEERWYCLFEVAMLLERLAAPRQEVREAYLAAYAARPSRAEPLYELARYLRTGGDHALAHLFALRAAAIPLPSDLLFVNTAVYSWRALDELASSAFYAGALDDGRMALDKLFAQRQFPREHEARLVENRRFYGLAPLAAT